MDFLDDLLEGLGGDRDRRRGRHHDDDGDGSLFGGRVGQQPHDDRYERDGRFGGGRHPIAAVPCRQCGTDMLPAFKFCPECGVPVTGVAPCAGCGAKRAAEGKFCPQCGRKYD